MKRFVILAPNWLGDAVMALPAVSDVRRGAADAFLAVAARPSVAPLFALVPGVDQVVAMQRRPWFDVHSELREHGFDAALLLPNSLRAAAIAARAGIPERWGYRADWRGRLLTRAIDRPAGLHQAAYYQHLVGALGFTNGPREPRLPIGDDRRNAAQALLAAGGWDQKSPLAAIAPGAAYGGAKRWPPERFAALATDLLADGVSVAAVGSAADRTTTNEVLGREPRIIDLVGRTDLPQLAGVLSLARTLVTNDSGAMHLAAAIGAPVTAVFGPTDEQATHPVGDRHAVIAGTAWCRPCLLRECPLDHRCMRSIDVATVIAAARRAL